MLTYLMRPLISRDNSARRFVAAPAFARRVCSSLSLFILVPSPPRRVPAPDPYLRFPEDVAAFRCFEVLSDCLKKKKKKCVFRGGGGESESIFAGL